METLDTDLCAFFFGVTQKHLDYLAFPERVKSVKKVLPEIRRKYKGDRPKKEGRHRNFQSLGNITVASRLEDVSHSYELLTCMASSTASSFSELMTKNVEFFGGKVSRKSVSVCCIAGVMASEMVAVVETLCRSTAGCGKQEFLNFQLAFVDSDERWITVTESVLRQLDEVVKAKYRIKLVSSFVRSQNRGEVLEVLRSSDVVIATEFSAQLSDMRVKKFRQLLEEALQHMKPDSLFFIIDSCSKTIIKCMEQDILKFGQFQTVYSKDCGNHSLSVGSTRHHLKRYNEYFGVDLGRSYCFFSVRAWQKSEKRRNSVKERPQTFPKANQRDTTERK